MCYVHDKIYDSEFIFHPCSPYKVFKINVRVPNIDNRFGKFDFMQRFENVEINYNQNQSSFHITVKSWTNAHTHTTLEKLHLH